MNIQECDILNSIISFTYTNQRKLVETSGHSLGVVKVSAETITAKYNFNLFIIIKKTSL